MLRCVIITKMANGKKIEDEILEVKKRDQYQTVEELMKRSKPNGVYYALLFISSFIIAAGLLLNNAAVVIGGMLVTPVLTPILLVGLGMSVGDLDFVKIILKFVGKSFLVVIASSLLLGLVFGTKPQVGIFALDDTLRGAALYFIVAIFSGLAATFAWVRKELNEILPGIAIAVSLVPPLSLIGIGFSAWAFDIVRFNIFIFFLNLVGVLMGSILVFSTLKFYKTKDKLEMIVTEHEKEERRKEKEKAKAKLKELKKKLEETIGEEE